MQSRSLKEIKDLYNRGVNVMQLFREMNASAANSMEGIAASYDLQAGSYVNFLNEPDHARFNEKYTAAIAGILDNYSPDSVMEAGVGEATTLANVLRHMKQPPLYALGFDISWSRAAIAREYSTAREVSPLLFVGNLAEIPIEDNSVEVVYTSHSIEPNRGREKQILAELFRVTRCCLVLLEPSNELGSAATRQHIDEHKYCLDLRRRASELGFDVVEYRLFDHTSNPYNQTALMVISKQMDAGPYRGTFFACPHCHCALVLHKENYFCTQCLVVYPVLSGLPCLARSHGIVATHYLEKA